MFQFRRALPPPKNSSLDYHALAGGQSGLGREVVEPENLALGLYFRKGKMHWRLASRGTRRTGVATILAIPFSLN